MLDTSIGSGWPASVKLDQVVSAGKYFKKHYEDAMDCVAQKGLSNLHIEGLPACTPRAGRALPSPGTAW